MKNRSRDAALQYSRRFYAGLAAYYDLIAQRTPVDRKAERQLDFIERIFKNDARRPVRRVLDIACGGGRHVVGLSRRGYECTGYDLAPERVEAARARAKRSGVTVTLRQADATNLPNGERYDAVLALNVLFLLPSDDDVKKCLRRVRRLISPRGVLVCNIVNPFTKGNHWMKDLIERGMYLERNRAPGVKITEVTTLSDFDPVVGEIWYDALSVIEAPDGRHVLHNKGRVRLLTYWDVKHYLEDAGFSEILTYNDWNLKSRKSRAEEIIFVAK